MIRFEQAKEHHLPDIVAMLADDPLGSAREDVSMPVNPAYVAAFKAILADKNQLLVVMLLDQTVVGTSSYPLSPASP